MFKKHKKQKKTSVSMVGQGSSHLPLKIHSCRNACTIANHPGVASVLSIPARLACCNSPSKLSGFQRAICVFRLDVVGSKLKAPGRIHGILPLHEEFKSEWPYLYA